MSTELVKYNVENFALLADLNAAQLAMHENFGETGINPNNLDRVKVPRDSPRWQVESVSGTQVLDELVGILVWKQMARRYWIDPDTTDSAPDCSSPDGQIGFGSPGGNCFECPKNQWGANGSGKPCSERRLLYLVQPGDVLPTVIDLPPTSINAFEKYLTGLTSKRIPFYGAITALRVTQDTGRTGRKFNLVTFRMVEPVPPQLLPEMQAFSRTIRTITATQDHQAPVQINPRPAREPQPLTPVDRNFKSEPPPAPPDPADWKPGSPAGQSLRQPSLDESPTQVQPQTQTAKADPEAFMVQKTQCRELFNALKKWEDNPPNLFQKIETWDEDKWKSTIIILRARAEAKVKVFFNSVESSLGPAAISAEDRTRFENLSTLYPRQLVEFGDYLNDKIEIPF